MASTIYWFSIHCRQASHQRPIRSCAMATDRCNRLTIAVVFTIASVKISMCTNIANIPGQARADDPNACFWFAIYNGPSIFRCCDGHFKTDAANPTELCIKCPSGSYGLFCQNNCTCINGGTCDAVDGFCNCPTGYFGNNCQYACNCQNGATCMHDGRCVCAEGFYGKLCQTNCSCPKNSECNGETGECICQDGFYGNSCLPCNCSDTEQCDPLTGVCTCRAGYYGEKCDRQCSCFNGAYCGNDQANSCICSSGWVGSKCTNCDTEIIESNGLLFCKNKCLHCYNGNGCSIENGDCLCSAGWQGNRCDKQCESGFYGNNCSEVCHCQNGMCDHVTGMCQCKSGWTGKHCEEPCPDNCVICAGDICTSCKPGWTGERCSTRCKPGFHGRNCQEPCIECNCTKHCHHIYGSCPDVVRCKENTCRYLNGRICRENPFQLECQDGWTGPLCDDRNTLTTEKDSLQLEYEFRTSASSRPHEVESPTCMDEGFSSSTLILMFILFAVVSVLINIAVVITACYYVKRQARLKYRDQDCGENGEHVEMDDHRRTGNTSDYVNIPGPRETTDNSAEYQHLCDFTYSQYQKLDTSSMGVFRT